jgi:hypothetical protein
MGPQPVAGVCTVLIGYHPSQYGDFLEARVLFGQIIEINQKTLDAEWDPSNPLYSSSASLALRIDPVIPDELAVAAEDTLLAGAARLRNRPPGR